MVQKVCKECPFSGADSLRGEEDVILEDILDLEYTHCCHRQRAQECVGVKVLQRILLGRGGPDGTKESQSVA